MEALQETLDKYGGLYSAQDIVDNVKAGTMQGFVVNDTWGVTQIIDYPRKRVLFIVAAIGNLDDSLGELNQQFIQYAKDIGAAMIVTYGRDGWDRVKPEGWAKISNMYCYEV